MQDTSYQRHQSLGGMINVVAFNIRERFAKRLAEHDLDLSVWPVLVCLWEQDGVAQGKIGDTLGVPGYAMSRGIDRLEAAGLANRRTDPNNRRLRRVFLTEAGRQLEAVLTPIANAINASVLGLLDDSEQQTLLALLQKIQRGLTPAP